MNDSVLTQLKVVVERAVRPVRASTLRKRRMREELLDHLLTIYEEELGRLEDEEAALVQAKRRFGDPGDLAAELRGSVSCWDSVCYVLELQRYRPGEPILRLALRHLLLSVSAMAMAFLLVLPTIWLRGKIHEIGLILHIVLVLGLFSAGFLFSLTVCVEQMVRGLHGGRSERPLRTVILCGLASLPAFPILTFLAYWSLLGSLASGLSGFGIGCAVAPAAPLFFFVLARQMREEILHEREWARIEIEE